MFFHSHTTFYTTYQATQKWWWKNATSFIKCLKKYYQFAHTNLFWVVVYYPHWRELLQVFLSRQKYACCHNFFVAASIPLSWQKTCFVAINWCLSRQKLYLGQRPPMVIYLIIAYKLRLLKWTCCGKWKRLLLFILLQQSRTACHIILIVTGKLDKEYAKTQPGYC